MLTVLTRTYKRPTFLARNRASLAAQTSCAYAQTVLEDTKGVGIAETYRRFQTLDVEGDYVWVFDDDNELTDPDFVAEIEALQGKPDVIICRVQHPLLGILPSAWPPKSGQIDMMNIIVSRDVWMRHRKDFAPDYAGDWYFIDAVLKTGPKITHITRVVGQLSAVMHGQSEADYLRTEHMKPGDKFRAVIDISGMDPDMTTFAYPTGSVVTVTEQNYMRVKSLAMGGLLTECEPAVARRRADEVSNRKRILVFCPTVERPEPEVAEAIFHQTYRGSLDFMITRDNPHRAMVDVLRNIQLAYEKMRQTVLKMGYDKVWIVESDTIPPLDALAKLDAVNAPVVGGLYALRHGAAATNLCWVNTQMQETGQGIHWDEVKAHWGEVIEVGGACMGCLLVERAALEDFSFITGERFAPDQPFANHCIKHGVKTMAHLGVVCGHKKDDGSILWPDNQTRLGYRTEKAA